MKISIFRKKLSPDVNLGRKGLILGRKDTNIGRKGLNLGRKDVKRGREDTNKQTSQIYI